MAKAGEILGYIGIAFSVLWIILVVTGNAVSDFDTQLTVSRDRPGRTLRAGSASCSIQGASHEPIGRLRAMVKTRAIPRPA